MELLVKPEMLTSYIYGPTFGNAETVSFFLSKCTYLNTYNWKAPEHCQNQRGCLKVTVSVKVRLADYLIRFGHALRWGSTPRRPE